MKNEKYLLQNNCGTCKNYVFNINMITLRLEKEEGDTYIYWENKLNNLKDSYRKHLKEHDVYYGKDLMNENEKRDIYKGFLSNSEIVSLAIQNLTSYHDRLVDDVKGLHLKRLTFIGEGLREVTETIVLYEELIDKTKNQIAYLMYIDKFK